MLIFRCPRCCKRFRYVWSNLRKRVRCPHCGIPVQMPDNPPDWLLRMMYRSVN